MIAEFPGCCARFTEVGAFTWQRYRLEPPGGHVAPYKLEPRLVCSCREDSRILEPGRRAKVAEVRSVRPGRAARTQVDGNVERRSGLTSKDQLPSSCRRLCEEGQLTEAVEALDLLVQRGCTIDTLLLYRVLRRCIGEKDLSLGKRVHALTFRCGYESNTFLANHIICMYASHRRLEEATEVFNKLASPDAHVWASIISAHGRHGQPCRALNLYRQMRESNVKPDNYVFVAALKACATAADLPSGKEVHADILKSAIEPDIFVGNCLVDMYAKCGSLVDARMVFDRLPNKDIVTSTVMIAGYAHHGLVHEALAVFAIMQRDSLTQANCVTYVCLLKACASARALRAGKEIHSRILERGLEADSFIGNCLVDMYAKCGSIQDARDVFDRIPKQDEVAWSAMIGGYSQHGLGEEALALYARMQEVGIRPMDHVTFVYLLKACASIGALSEGKKIHLQITEQGLEDRLVVGNSLIVMYVKCGSLEDARSVFDRLCNKDVVTWNAMIGGYAQHGHGHEALALYASMEQRGIALTDHVTFVCLLKACASAGAIDDGKRIHSQILEQGLEANVVVGNCLVDMYSKLGCIDDAHNVFARLPTRDVVTWTAMIAGYVQQGMGREALALYASMQEMCVSLTDHTFVCLMKACASVGALRQGQKLHEEIQARGLEANVIVGNCLVDMYAKWGRLEDARKVFHRLLVRDVVTWNALLNGYAEHSDGEMAIQCFEEMQQQGVKPNDVTFVCLLVACSHAGLVSEGQEYFQTMEQVHGVMPSLQHYNCMVDLLGRSGSLAEAEHVLQTMPFMTDVVGWTTLLSACKTHSDVERANRCFDNLVKLEPGNATAYVLLANIYANASRWSDVDRIETLRKSVGAWKSPAKACIEVQNKVQEFIVGEERIDIGSKLRSSSFRLKEEGYLPQTQLVLKALPESTKEEALCGHAEKLAVAYGLLNTPDGTALLVTKNLRMCNDCHSSTKILSRLEKRKIVVRDTHRVHHFVDGLCSCRDNH